MDLYSHIIETEGDQYDVLIESARLRARESLRLPDGIHLATAWLERCEAFLSNDLRIRSRPGLEVVRLPRAM